MVFPQIVQEITAYTYKVARLEPVFGSHSLIGTWLSLLPEATKDFVGCQSTHLTSAPWPSNISMQSSWFNILAMRTVNSVNKTDTQEKDT